MSPDLCTIIVGIIHALATLLSAAVVDKLGRKLLLMVSVSIVILCLGLLGIFFYMLDRDETSVEDLGWLPLASLSIYTIVFALGLGPVPWVMLGEVYSNDMKPIASPITGAFNWSLAFLITNTFGMLSDEIGIGETFWMFAVAISFGVLFVIFIVPETKGKSLQEIQLVMLNVENKTEK